MERKSPPTPALSPADAAAALQALASETRLAVLRQLVRAGASGLPCGVLQQRLGLPGSTLSHHLRALVGAGVLEQKRQGRVLLCRARYDRIAALAAFLTDQCCADVRALVPAGEETA